MERYRNSLIPLIPEAIMAVHEPEILDEMPSSSRKRRRANGATHKGRETRKEMTASFNILQSLVPNLSPKVIRSILNSTDSVLHTSTKFCFINPVLILSFDFLQISRSILTLTPRDFENSDQSCANFIDSLQISRSIHSTSRDIENSDQFRVLHNQATRENIVSETIRFIDLLQKKLRNLEIMQKKPSESVTMLPGTYSDSSDGVIVSFSGEIVLFGIVSSVRRGLVTQILMVFERHQAEVLAASVAVSHGRLSLTVTASVRDYGEDAVQKIKNDIIRLKN